MENKNLENIFYELRGKLDTEEPNTGHAQRFLEKLEASKTISINKRKYNWWTPLAIAASVALLIAFGGIHLFSTSLEDRVAGISPEVSQTELYFTSLINDQVKKLEDENAPETKKIIEDTMVQLTRLETDYKTLEQDLLKGGNSKFILSAMITNFQTRIDLLQDVMEKIETIKTLRNYTDENNI